MYLTFFEFVLHSEVVREVKRLRYERGLINFLLLVVYLLSN